MSRMCSAWTSVNSNGSAMQRRRWPAGRSSDARMVAMISSIMSRALMQALDDVGPVLGLAQAELGPAGDDLDLVVDVACEGLRAG